jgi:hypothetical protein
MQYIAFDVHKHYTLAVGDCHAQGSTSLGL